MDEPTIATPILIGHAESKRALAVFAHLRRIIETVTRDDRIIRPIQMDHADLLLASASMRALLFDGNPVLIDFAKMHGLEIEIECFETNIALFLLSWLVPDDLHISDYLVHALLDPTTRDKYELNKPTQQVLTFREKTGFESALRRPDILLPNEG